MTTTVDAVRAAITQYPDVAGTDVDARHEIHHDDGGPRNVGVTILEFRGERVAHETIYGGPAWDAPQWRVPWRAAPPTAEGPPA